MTKTVNIEIYCDNAEDGEKDVFAVLSEHRPDLPKPFDQELQNWASENFNNLEIGDSIFEAGEFVYEPNDEIVEMRKKDS